MSIIVIGVNHRTAPLAVLERLSISADHLAKAVAGLAQRDNVREAAVLTTCGRTEVYVVAERFHGAYADVTAFLSDVSSMSVDELHPHLVAHHDLEAARHLFEVAAGLDSVVPGEGEVLGQVRGAWDVARGAGTVRTTLDVMFRQAVKAGKRARTETAIARGTASISHAAVELAAEHLGTVAGRRVLVIGAGEMGRGVTTALRKAGAADIVVANRTPARGAELAARVGGRVIGFDDLPDSLVTADVVVTCTGASEIMLRTDALMGVRTADHPLLVVDTAVPRDVDPGVADVAGVTLLDLDDLSAWAKRGLAARADEAARVRTIIDEELERFVVECTARQAAPLVAQLHDRAEFVRAKEVERFASRLAASGNDPHDVVEALTRSIVAKLLHHPSVRLRADAGTPQGERNAAAVTDLFDL
ncbi:glutamyl-tRNA reductase [soil metagenome]